MRFVLSGAVASDRSSPTAHAEFPVPKISLPPLLVAAVLLGPGTLAAQSPWSRPLAGPAEFSLEWVRPTFKNNDDLFGSSRGVWVLGARIRVSEKVNAVLAVPEIRGPSLADPNATATKSGVPYLGLELLGQGRRPEISLGLRLPQLGGSDQTWSYALLSDFDRFEEGVPDLMTFTAVSHFRPWEDADGSFAEFRLGGAFTRNTAEGATDPTDFYADYGVRIGRERDRLALGLALTGRWWLTPGDGGGIADHTWHHGTADIAYRFGAIRPSFGLRVPFDENFKDVIKYTALFGVTVDLR